MLVGGREPRKDVGELEGQLIDRLADFCKEHDLPEASVDDLEASIDGEYLRIFACEENADIVQKRTGHDWDSHEGAQYFIFDNAGCWIKGRHFLGTSLQ